MVKFFLQYDENPAGSGFRLWSGSHGWRTYTQILSEHTCFVKPVQRALDSIKPLFAFPASPFVGQVSSAVRDWDLSSWDALDVTYGRL